MDEGLVMYLDEVEEGSWDPAPWDAGAPGSMGFATKVCPRCGERVYADMTVCYGCLFDFSRGMGRAGVDPAALPDPGEPPGLAPVRSGAEESSPPVAEGSELIGSIGPVGALGAEGAGAVSGACEGPGAARLPGGSADGAAGDGVMPGAAAGDGVMPGLAAGSVGGAPAEAATMQAADAWVPEVPTSGRLDTEDQVPLFAPGEGPWGFVLSTPSSDSWVWVGERGVVVGRDPACDVVLHASSVSRRHLFLRPRPEGMEATDLGATNPTSLHGRPLVGRSLVPWGDSVDVCGCVLTMTGPSPG